jgi:putative transposase
LACMVYIDLNPVRAGRVEQAHEFEWSSHRHCIGQVSDKLVTPHALFWGLGNTPFAREAAYAALVQTGLSRADIEPMTRSALSGWALGSADFLQELQQSTTRRLSPGSGSARIPTRSREPGPPRRSGPRCPATSPRTSPGVARRGRDRR